LPFQVATHCHYVLERLGAAHDIVAALRAQVGSFD
jgi:hypothetical protein